MKWTLQPIPCSAIFDEPVAADRRVRQDPYHVEVPGVDVPVRGGGGVTSGSPRNASS